MGRGRKFSMKREKQYYLFVDRMYFYKLSKLPIHNATSRN